MPNIKYPEFSVKITIKDADSGVLDNATFVGNLDHMSLDLSNQTNLVAFRKKNTNKKPFIWGISKWGEDYHYLDDNYLGISTLGSGVGAELTLTFSEPTSHFTIYFDEIAQSMPTSLTIGTNTIENDDYVFSYGQETAQTSFVFTINDMNVINDVKMPLMIVGIEAKVELNFNHSNGLKTVRASRTFTSDKTKPAYGIISQDGALGLFDYYTELNDLIGLGLLTADKKVEIKFVDNVVGNYTTNKWTEEQENLFNVSLNDRLLQWQEINITKNYSLELNKTAKDLYNYWISLNADLEFILDTTTDNLLQSIAIKYYYWEASTEWQFVQKLCDLAQLYIYQKNDGKIVVISQKRINEIKSSQLSNPTIISYALISGNPKKDRLVSNKITQVEISETINNYDFRNIGNIGLLTYTQFPTPSVTFDGGNGLTFSGWNKISNFTPISAKVDGLVIVHENKNYIAFATATYNLTIVKYRLSDIKFNRISDFCYFKVVANINNVSTPLSYPNYLIKNSDTSIIEIDSVYTNELTLLSEWIDENGNIGSLPANAVFDSKILKTDNEYYVYFLILKNAYLNSDKYYSILLENITFDVQLKSLETTTKSSSYGVLSDNKFTIPNNEFLTSDTLLENFSICQYNANQILSNFTGKQTISFSCAIDDLYYKNGIWNENLYNEYSGAIGTGIDGVYTTHLYSEYNFDEYAGKYSLNGEITNFENILVEHTYYIQYSNLSELIEIYVTSTYNEGNMWVHGNIKEFNSIYQLSAKKYDYNNGSMLQELNLIQLRKTDGTLEPEIWQVTKVEIDAVGGKNFINIEGVQV
jgi:hypothetical protein